MKCAERFGDGSSSHIGLDLEEVYIFLLSIFCSLEFLTMLSSKHMMVLWSNEV